MFWVDDAKGSYICHSSFLLEFRTFYINVSCWGLYQWCSAIHYFLSHCRWQLDTMPMPEEMETAVASTGEVELKTPSPLPPKIPLEKTPDKARTYFNFDIYMAIA